MSGSTIAGDLVLLSLARADADPARVKDFHLALNYSEDRVSQILKGLTADGWLAMSPNPVDRRMRNVLPTDRLQRLFDEYQRFLLNLLRDEEARHELTSTDRDSGQDIS